LRLLYLLDLAGVAVFAVSGALAAGRKQMDVFGVVVLALVTAVGGGTLRDLLLDRTVFWIADPSSVIVAAVAALATVVTLGRAERWPRTLLMADALGLAMFAVLGAQAALSEGVPATVAAVMGMLSGVAGGIIRDLLAGEVPLVLRREVYATAALAGAALLVALRAAGLTGWPPVIAGMLLAFGMRAAALLWKLSLPIFRLPASNR
jgi:uncharacterized membrane protein YeiH